MGKWAENHKNCPLFAKKPTKTLILPTFRPKNCPLFTKIRKSGHFLSPFLPTFICPKMGKTHFFWPETPYSAHFLVKITKKFLFKNRKSGHYPKYFSPKPTFRNRNLARNHHHSAHFSNTIQDYLLNYLIYHHRYDEYI